jgi:hypothetical protein
VGLHPHWGFASVSPKGRECPSSWILRGETESCSRRSRRGESSSSSLPKGDRALLAATPGQRPTPCQPQGRRPGKSSQSEPSPEGAGQSGMRILVSPLQGWDCLWPVTQGVADRCRRGAGAPPGFFDIDFAHLLLHGHRILDSNRPRAAPSLALRVRLSQGERKFLLRRSTEGDRALLAATPGPKAHPHVSPGRRPGKSSQSEPSPEGAGQSGMRILVSPLQGWDCFSR